LTAVDARNPFAGLQSFGETDQAYFRGRDAESRDLFRLVRREALTVLFARSGLGKTSLLHAGLFPLLREAQYLPVSIRLDFLPGEALESRVKARIGEALLREGVDAIPPDDETLWEYFHQARWWSPANRLLTPVLVFDQFEEIFTLGRGDSRVAPLLTELADVIENQIPASVRSRLARSGEELPFSYDRRKVHVVFSLREDFLARLEDLRPQIPSIVASRFRLVQMTGPQARQAIIEPAGGLVGAEVTEEILRFVAGNGQESGPEAVRSGIEDLEIEPALLSLVCRELNERRLAQGLPALTSRLLHRARGEILTDFYEKGLTGLPTTVRAFIEDRLLTASGFRHSEPLEEAVRLPGVTEEHLRLLVDRRVLRFEPRLGHLHVELIHDLLTRVVRESRDRRQARQRRRRQQLRWTTAALALIVLLAGIGWAALRQRELKRKSQAHRAQAEEVLNFMLFDLGEELSPIGRLDLIKGVQEAALEYFESLPVDSASPSSARQRAAAFLNLGRIYSKEGRTTAAIRSFEQGLALATRSAGPGEPSPDLLATQALLRRSLGLAKLSRGDSRGGFAEIWTGCQLLRQLTLRQPANLQWQEHLSLCLISLSNQFETRGDLDRALEIKMESLTLRERLARANPGLQRQNDRASDYIKLADLLQKKGETKRASALYRAALSICQQLISEEPDNASWQESLVYVSGQLANHLAEQGEPGRALEISRESLRIAQQLAERDPGNSSWQSILADSYVDVGDLLIAQGEKKQVLAAYSSARPLILHLASQDPENTQNLASLSIIYERFADAYETQGNLQRALEFYRQSLDVDRRLSAEDPGNIYWKRNLAISLHDFGNLHVSLGDVEGSIEHYSNSLELRKQLVARSPTDMDLQSGLASVHLDLGDALLAHGDPQKAILHLEESRKIYRRLAGSKLDDLNSYAWAYVSSGRAHERLGQRDRARQDWRRAVEILEPATAGSENLYLLDTYTQALLLLGWKEKSRPFVKTLLEQGWNDDQFLKLVRRNGLGRGR
jgi:tetratricopeptide (TPR) repeat protein